MAYEPSDAVIDLARRLRYDDNRPDDAEFVLELARKGYDYEQIRDMLASVRSFRRD